METYLNYEKVEGFLFKYMHFYGSYNYVATSRQWYRNEIRVIRNNIGVQSFQDAQGFSKYRRFVIGLRNGTGRRDNVERRVVKTQWANRHLLIGASILQAKLFCSG